MRLTLLILCVLVVGACKEKGPTQPTSGNSQLTVHVLGKIPGGDTTAAINAGQVTVFVNVGPAEMKGSIVNGVAVITGLPDGNHKTRTGADFGYRNLDEDVNVSGNTERSVTLTPKDELSFEKLECTKPDGSFGQVQLGATTTCVWPALVRVKLKAMGASFPGQTDVSVSGLTFSSILARVEPGQIDMNVERPDLTPWCFDQGTCQSKTVGIGLFKHIEGSGSADSLDFKFLELVINWQRR